MFRIARCMDMQFQAIQFAWKEWKSEMIAIQ